MREPYRHERSRRETGRAQERLAELRRYLERRQGEPPLPGDLFALEVTADLPVEWLVVEGDAAGGGSLLLVPADTHPLVGSADVEVPTGAPGGPLSLRCRYAEWVGTEVLTAGRRTGFVHGAVVERVRQKRRALAAGEPVPTREREVDAETEYRDWTDEVVAPARQALVRSRVSGLPAPGKPAPSPPVSSPAPMRSGAARWLPAGWARALAALLFLATLGLASWVAALKRELEGLSRPVLDVHLEEVLFGEVTRGPHRIEIASGSPYLVLSLVLGGDLPVYDRYRLQIVDRSRAPVWTSPPLAGGPYAHYPLLVPRRALPFGEVRLRLYGLSGAGAALLEERVLTVQAERPKT